MPAHGVFSPPGKLTGTPGQIEWAEQIRPRVADEFDRVAAAFQTAAGRQSEQDRIETLALIAILEEKRSEVLANDRAGYFIRDWQELSGRVRQMIGDDPRYHAIRDARSARRHKEPAGLSAGDTESQKST